MRVRGRGRRGQRADAWASGCKHDAAGERRDEGRWVRRAKDGGAGGRGGEVCAADADAGGGRGRKDGTRDGAVAVHEPCGG